MNNHPKHIGKLIRQYRKLRNMTGAELGVKAGLSQSKISKIETGFYKNLDKAEIKKILNILEVSSTITQHTLRLFQSVDTSDILDSPLTANFSKRSTKWEYESKLIRLYAGNVIPAILQTTEYRMVLLKHYDIDALQTQAILKEAMTRQDLLWQPGREFRIIMPQTALYTFAGTKQIHLTQLDRLERSISLPAVRLGIIPVEAGLTFIENSSFSLYDSRILIQAVARNEILSEDKDDIAMHETVFRAFEELAVYEADAVRLIRAAMTYLAA